MKLTLMRVLHQTPGLRSVSKRIHPAWFFKTIYYSVTMTELFWPHTKKLAQPFRAVVGENFDPPELRVRSRRYLLFLRLFKDLEVAWKNWEERHHEWVTVEGEVHLAKALEAGKGAIFLSCHNFGFSKLVPPALALRGYNVYRGGGGKKDGRRVSRWGRDYRMDWSYIDYGGDYWAHLKSLRAVNAALAKNEILHVSPRAYPRGDDEMSVEFFGRKYYLDTRWFRLFEKWRAPVMPCFAVATTDGRVEVKIHPILPAAAQSMAEQFSRLASEYLTESPELGRLWKDVYLGREF